MQKGGWVYLLTNKGHSVIYTGVTSDLVGRILQQQQKTYPRSFTARYNINTLIYFLFFEDIREAIEEEKRIKAGSRTAKIKLVTTLNPNWQDLWIEIVSTW